MSRARFGERERVLRSTLQLSAPPVAVGFHSAMPPEPPPCDGVMPAPAPDGWTAGLMTLLDAWPDLRIEGKPQCHSVALAKEHGQVAASVGCALSRARTHMPTTEATAAIPITVLDDLVERLTVAAEANRAVARYADASRFAVGS